MSFSEYLISRVNFRNGSFIIVTMMLFCCFIATILLFTFDFTTVADEDFAANFWEEVSLQTSLVDFWHRPWTVLTYAFFDHHILSVFSSVFWVMAFGYFVEEKRYPTSSLSIFMIATLVSGLNMCVMGTFTDTTEYITSARIPILSLASVLLWSSQGQSIHLSTLVIPVKYLAYIYLAISVVDVIVSSSYLLATGYVTSLAVGAVLSRPIGLLSRWDRDFSRFLTE